jgi:hypothetical protein
LCVGTSSAIAGTSASIVAEHVTVHTCSALFNAVSGSPTLSVTNSIIVGVANLGSGVTTNSTLYLASDPGSVFQTVGAGEHYLANGSAHENAGNSVSATTAAILAKTTTKPPTVKTGLATTSQNLWSQNLGDINTPDRGYHYPIIDFIADNFGVTNTATVVTLTLSTNVVVATYNGNGLVTGPTSLFVSEGIPPGMNRIVRYNTVQEKPTLIGPGAAYAIRPNNSASATVRFTEFSALTGSHLFVNGNIQFNDLLVRDSHFRTAGITFNFPTTSSATLTFANNVVEAGNIDFWGPNTISCINNLFYAGRLEFMTDFLTANFTFKDNAFDRTDIVNIFGDSVVNSHNGYLNYTGTVPRLLPNHASDVIGNFLWATGALGRFYHLSTNLLNVGSRNATNAGLFHFTTQASQAKETNSVVDIGAHYLALDGSLPSDYDADGVADYVEDPNGNGVLDSGETPWSHDKDYDGVPTWVEIYEGTNPDDPNEANKYRLGYWKFDSTDFLKEPRGPGGQSYAPINPTTHDVTTSSSWSGSAGAYVSTGGLGPSLHYKEVDPDSWPNFNCRNGTVRFWIKPDWTSDSLGGDGPGQTATVLSIGDGNEYWHLYITPNGNELVLQFHANNYYKEIKSPLTLMQNRWACLAVTYSPTSIAFYTNGACSKGSDPIPPRLNSNTSSIYLPNLPYGVTFWPGEVKRGYGLGIGGGSPLSPGFRLFADLDEFETFNYPLSEAEIAAAFPTFVGASSVQLDTDYDGRSDLVETQVDGTSYNTSDYANQFKQVRLAYFRFNEPTFTGQQGQVPVSSSGLSQSAGWSGDYLNVSSSSSANLTYRDVEASGSPNFNARRGSVRFWFKPNAIPGNGSVGTFLDMGTSHGGQRWELRWEGTGSNLRLITSRISLGPITNLNESYTFDTSKWAQIVVTYTTNATKLFINGVQVGSDGTGITAIQDLTSRANGLVIGNRTGGGQPINGLFDELETFNYDLLDTQIASDFARLHTHDLDSNGVADILEDIPLSSSQPFPGTPFVVTGVIEAEQFDKGGLNKGYYKGTTNVYSDYRTSRVQISPTTDLGLGYCIEDMRINDWVQYSLDVRVGQTYCVEPRVLWAGTNAAYKIEFSTNSGTSFYTGLTNYVTSSSWTNGWTNVATKNVVLTNGFQIMRVTMLTNGVWSGTNVGFTAKFNYVSIYPSWNEGFTITSTNAIQTNELSTATDWATARENADVIQGYLNAAQPGTSIRIPPGIFYVAQPPEDSFQLISGEAYEHAALRIMTNNIEIRGAGRDLTKLIAFNRMTTIINAGKFDQQARCRSNLIIRDIEFEARPHVITVTNATPVYNITERGAWQINGVEMLPKGAGALVSIIGYGDAILAQNILIENCRFRNADRALALPKSVANALVRGNEFICLDPDGPYTGETDGNDHTSRYPLHSPQIIGIGGFRDFRFNPPQLSFNFNIVILDNEYNGNPAITSSTSPAEGWATDGFVYFQRGGNYFCARNRITNYFLEAIYFTSGPIAVVQNEFGAKIHGASTKGLAAANMADPPATLTESARDDMFAFVGNSVVGGALAWSSRFPTNNADGSFTTMYPMRATFSGNDIELSPPWHPGEHERDRAAGGFDNMEFLNVSGNTLHAGYKGIVIDPYGTKCSLILKNDLEGAEQGGVFIESQYPNGTAVVVKNILNHGRSFHVFGTASDPNKIFVLKNDFRKPGGTNSAVYDRKSLPVHFNP